MGLAQLFGLAAIDLEFLFNDGLRDILAADIEGFLVGRDLKQDVLYQSLEFIIARDEIGLAVDFDQDADLAARVDVRRNHPFIGRSAHFLAGRGQPFLSQPVDRLVHIIVAFHQRLLAVHNSGSRLLPEIFDQTAIPCHVSSTPSGYGTFLWRRLRRLQRLSAHHAFRQC